jgi:hypothetical protein
MDSCIEIISPPDDLVEIYKTIFSEDLKEFVVKICRQFDSKLDRIFVERLKRRILLEEREMSEVDESLESLADFVAKKFTGLESSIGSVTQSLTPSTYFNAVCFTTCTFITKSRYTYGCDVICRQFLSLVKCLSSVMGVRREGKRGHLPPLANQNSMFFDFFG